MSASQSQRPSFTKDALREKRAAQKRRMLHDDVCWSLTRGLAGGVAALLIAFVVITAWGDAIGAVVPDGQGWVPVAAMMGGLAIGWGLAFLKWNKQSSYALGELGLAAIGIVVGTARLLHCIHDVVDRGGAWTAGVGLVGALYVAARGFANRKEAREKEWALVREETVASLIDEARNLSNQSDTKGAMEKLMKALEATT
jgi:hypothetical protein